MKLPLECTEAQFHSLTVAADTRRKRIQIERDALAALLRDHSRVLAEARVDLTPSYAPATLARAVATP